MIDVFGEVPSIAAEFGKMLFVPLLGVTALYSVKFEYSDELAIDMALAKRSKRELDELGWVPLTKLIEPQSETNAASRRMTRRRILLWGLPKLQGLNGPPKSAARRYRLNNATAVLAGLLASVYVSVWLTLLLVLIFSIGVLRTPNWPVPKGLNA